MSLFCVLALSACAGREAPSAPAEAGAVEAGQSGNKPAETEHGKPALGTSEKRGSANYSGNFVSSLDEDDEYLENPVLTQTIADPLEPWNRFWFNVNDLAITYVATPVRDGYVFIMPKPVRTGLGNFFHNLLFPVRFVNNTLQGKMQAAGMELGSFLLDTTFGFAGLVNVSQEFRDEYIPDDEDTGQTLGAWGIGEGIYLVWPLLGPSNLRDTAGLVGDHFLDPFTYLEPWELALAAQSVRVVNNLDGTISQYEAFKKMAVEPYSAIRDGYTQYRRAKIAK